MIPPSRWRWPLWALAGLVWGLAVSTAVAIEPSEIDGEASFRLDDLARRLQLQMRRTGVGEGTLELTGRGHRAIFRQRERFFHFDGVKVALGRSIVAEAGALWITALDYERTLQPLLIPEVFSGAPGPVRRVLIDAGHGGKDPGAQNTEVRLREKSLTLDLAKRLRSVLEERGYAVRLTRADDRFLSLAERGALARTEPTDLFVSLHFNAAENAAVEGVETYAFTPAGQASTARHRVAPADRIAWPANEQDVWNVQLGFQIQRALVSLPRTSDRGLKRARFGVLRDLPCPGVLIEGGFVSHPREGRDIGSAGYRESLANAIADGIDAFEATLQTLR